MDDWDKINETSFLKKKFFSHLNMEDITDADYTYAKEVCREFKIKTLGEYHELYIQNNNTLILIPRV